MAQKKVTLLFVLLLSLAVVTVSNGALTKTCCDSEQNVCAFHPNSKQPCIYKSDQLIQTYDSALTSAATEFLQPTVALIDLPASPFYQRSLPEVPKAIFMVLAGFLCVSLVKDRKVWMAALLVFIWIGQTGFAALPQLVLHLYNEKQIDHCFSRNVTYSLDSSNCCLQAAILLERFILNPLLKCLAINAEHYLCFLPAFTFVRLARGPPQLF